MKLSERWATAERACNPRRGGLQPAEQAIKPRGRFWKNSHKRLFINTALEAGGCQDGLIGIRAIRSRNSMDANSAEEFLKRKYTLWIVSLLTIVLFLVTNLPWQLDDYDQAKQAFTSFEMVKEGRWLYQHTPHERVATK